MEIIYFSGKKKMTLFIYSGKLRVIYFYYYYIYIIIIYIFIIYSLYNIGYIKDQLI